jgi:hypothetical protein
MHSKDISNIKQGNKVYTKLHIYSVLSLSLICMRVWNSDILVYVQGQRKMSQVLGAFGLLDFTML